LKGKEILSDSQRGISLKPDFDSLQRTTKTSKKRVDENVSLAEKRSLARFPNRENASPQSQKITSATQRSPQRERKGKKKEKREERERERKKRRGKRKMGKRVATTL
jgi:hypothetical protein